MEQPLNIEQMKILRIRDIEEITSLSRTTLWRRIKAGDFPQPVSLGGKFVGWRTSTIEEWLKNLPKADIKQ